jgi:hypothetical protein
LYIAALETIGERFKRLEPGYLWNELGFRGEPPKRTALERM